MKMFEKASRLKLRFSFKGTLSVEDLWDLTVQDLDEIFKKLNAKIKTQAEESLLDEQSKADKVLATKINIVKHIVKVKLAEKEARENASVNRARRQKLLEILEQKQDESLHNLSPEKLQELIAELS